MPLVVVPTTSKRRATPGNVRIARSMTGGSTPIISATAAAAAAFSRLCAPGCGTSSASVPAPPTKRQRLGGRAACRAPAGPALVDVQRDVRVVRLAERVRAHLGADGVRLRAAHVHEERAALRGERPELAAERVELVVIAADVEDDADARPIADERAVRLARLRDDGPVGGARPRSSRKRLRRRARRRRAPSR